MNSVFPPPHNSDLDDRNSCNNHQRRPLPALSDSSSATSGQRRATPLKWLLAFRTKASDGKTPQFMQDWIDFALLIGKNPLSRQLIRKLAQVIEMLKVPVKFSTLNPTQHADYINIARDLKAQWKVNREKLWSVVFRFKGQLENKFGTLRDRSVVEAMGRIAIALARREKPTLEDVNTYAQADIFDDDVSYDELTYLVDYTLLELPENLESLIIPVDKENVEGSESKYTERHRRNTISGEASTAFSKKPLKRPSSPADSSSAKKVALNSNVQTRQHDGLGEGCAEPSRHPSTGDRLYARVSGLFPVDQTTLLTCQNPQMTPGSQVGSGEAPQANQPVTPILQSLIGLQIGSGGSTWYAGCPGACPCYQCQQLSPQPQDGRRKDSLAGYTTTSLPQSQTKPSGIPQSPQTTLLSRARSGRDVSLTRPRTGPDRFAQNPQDASDSDHLKSMGTIPPDADLDNKNQVNDHFMMRFRERRSHTRSILRSLTAFRAEEQWVRAYEFLIMRALSSDENGPLMTVDEYIDGCVRDGDALASEQSNS
ncbi:hypothetical protein LZ30DRAFT_47986 [Colletotrichum cereale]|nr:hypothetical protein LZ30DRAFT_47986 [Colletotrichum cereale]